MDHATSFDTTTVPVNVISIADAEDAAETAALLARLNAGDADEEGNEESPDEVGEEASNRNFVYHEIKQQLIAAGIPEQEIAFIQDAKTPAERETLFAKVRKGEIRVFLGSTMRMGVGVNVQERCYAVHHLTTPWRPCDVKQADGRIWRPGNLFPEVWIFRYIAAPSFDGFSWQGIETKGRFEDAYLRGDPTVREMSDIDEQIISAGELKALASGDGRIVQKVRLEHELGRLKQQRSTWETGRTQARLSAIHADRDAQKVNRRIERLRHYLSLRIDDKTITLFGSMIDLTNPAEARANGKAIRDALVTWGEAVSSTDLKRDGRVMASCGSYRGLPLYTVIDLDGNGKKKLPYLVVADTIDGKVAKIVDALINVGDIGSVLPKLEGAVNSIENRIARLEQEAAGFETEAARFRTSLEATWEHAQTYTLMSLGLRYLNAVLDEDATGTEATIAEILALAEGEGLDIHQILQQGQQIVEKGVDLSTIRVTLPPRPGQAEAAQEIVEPEAARETAPEPLPENVVSISVFADPRQVARPTLDVATLDLKDMATEAARKRAEIAKRKRQAQVQAGQMSFFHA
jgi:hypothetical protein